MIKNEEYQTALYQAKIELSLYDYIKEAWEWCDFNKYIDNWHVGAICEHLQATYTGEIKRLTISIPPSFAKSLITSVMFPSWCWINKPQLQFLTGSNTADLSTRDTLRTRQLILSDWYQYHWGNKFKLSTEQNEKTYYRNDKFGHRYSFSTGSRFTGQRADGIILDDPLNFYDSFYRSKKKSVNQLITGGLSTRFNDEKNGFMVLMGQRLCKDDPIGYVLENRKGWVYLCLPLEFDKNRKCKTPIFEDPRTKEKETLWENRWDKEAIQNKKNELGSTNFEIQYNQKAVDKENLLFKFDKCEYYETPPNFIKIVDCWDTAFSDKQQSDYSVCITWGVTKNMHYILNVWRKQVRFPELKRKMVEINAKYGSNEVWVEAKATGVPAVDELKMSTRLPFKLINPIKDKVSRAHAASPAFEAGKIALPKNAPWLYDYRQELEEFPESEHDDQVDATTLYLVNMIKPLNYDRLFKLI